MNPESASEGLRDLVMPAEWNRHRATWVAWPHNIETWPNNLREAQAEFIQLVAAIAQGETVCVIASGEALNDAQKQLANMRSMEFFDIPTNDAWIRDYGPTFVFDRRTKETSAVLWTYNGWGEKYPPFDDDQKSARRIVDHLDMEFVESALVIEGGAIEVDGQGTLITTESCLLNSNRNGAARRACNDALGKHCGAEHVIWLPGAELDGDDTDGHIDQQARFVDNDILVVAKDRKEGTRQSVSLEENRVALARQLEILNRVTEIVEIPLPTPFKTSRSAPASYMNFYMCNAGILLPQFGDPDSDGLAAHVLGELRPDRPVIGLPSVHLAVGLGSFHCLTQPEPALSAG